eukprot:2923480-Pyramimonas_sp.AAC.1
MHRSCAKAAPPGSVGRSVLLGAPIERTIKPARRLVCFACQAQVAFALQGLFSRNGTAQKHRVKGRSH